MEVTALHGELCSLFRNIIYPWRKLTIGVDGWDGVGKSGLARYLAWEFDLPTIEMDMFIVPGVDPPSYRYEDLGRLIDSRHRLNRPVIVEGVFLLHTMQELGVECDFLVYVERDDHCSEEYLEVRLKKYDNEFHPKKLADYVFVWTEDR